MNFINRGIDSNKELNKEKLFFFCKKVKRPVKFLLPAQFKPQRHKTTKKKSKTLFYSPIPLCSFIFFGVIVCLFFFQYCIVFSCCCNCTTSTKFKLSYLIILGSKMNLKLFEKLKNNENSLAGCFYSLLKS